eukprot:scaffold339671_cov17-Prasinocladus_malaysianus.AAC.1
MVLYSFQFFGRSGASMSAVEQIADGVDGHPPKKIWNLARQMTITTDYDIFDSKQAATEVFFKLCVVSILSCRYIAIAPPP